MAASLWQSATNNPANVAAGVTQRFAIGSGMTPGLATAEASAQVMMREAGVWSLLTASVTTNTRGTSTIVTRKNAATAAQSLSIPSSTTGAFSDVTNTDSIGAGEKWNGQLTTGSGGSSFALAAASVVFTPTAAGDTITRLVTSGSSVTGSTVYGPVQGSSSYQGVEADATTTVPISGTLQNAGLGVSANTRSVNATMTVRQTGADTALAVTIPAGTTGYFEDTTNTATLTAGDTINWKHTPTAGTGGITIQTTAVSLVNPNGQWLLGCAPNGVVSPSANTTTYYPSTGYASSAATTEATSQNALNVDGLLTNLGIRLTSNTVTATSTLRSRLNGANGAEAVSISASTTGHFRDITNSDAAVASDLVNLALTTGATGGLMNITVFEWAVNARTGTRFSPFLTGF